MLWVAGAGAFFGGRMGGLASARSRLGILFCRDVHFNFTFELFFLLVVVLLVNAVPGLGLEVCVTRVGGGSLQAVEEQSSGLVIDLAGEESIQRIADGELDRFLVFEQGKLEGELEAGGAAHALGAFAGGLVKETVRLVFQGGRVATSAVGFHMATEFDDFFFFPSSHG